MFNPNLSDAGIPSQSPFLSGMSQGADTYTQLLSAFAAPQMMKLKQQQAQADLQRQQLANQFYTPDIQSQIDQRKTQTQLMPVNTAVSLQNTLNQANNDKRMQQQRGWAWTLNRQLQSYSPAARNTWIAQNADLYARMLDETIGQMTNPAAQNAGTNILTPQFLQAHGFSPAQNNQVSPQAMQQLSPQQQQAFKQLFQGNGSPVPTPDQAGNPVAPQQAPNQMGAPLMPAAQASQLNPAMQQGAGMQAVAAAPAATPPEWINPQTGQPQLVVGGETPQFTPVQQQQLMSMNAANRAATGPQIQNRMQGAITLANFMYSPEVQNELVTLSKYQSLLGKSEAFVKSKLSPEEMAEYNNAKERLPILISGSMKSLEGLPTSELGMKAGGDFINISSNQKAWNQDPDAALKDWLAAYRLADTEMRSIAKTAQPAFEVYKFPDQPPSIIANSLSNKDKVNDQFTNKLTAAPVRTFGGAKAIQASDGKWYMRDQNGRLVETKGGQ